MDAMLDSFSKTMSRSGLMSTFNSAHKSGGNVSSSGGSSTLSRSSLGKCFSVHSMSDFAEVCCIRSRPDMN